MIRDPLHVLTVEEKVMTEDHCPRPRAKQK